VFDLFQTSRRPSWQASTPGFVVSAVLHAVLIGAVVYERVSNPTNSNTWTDTVEGLTYVAPPDVNSAASKTVIRYQESGGAGGVLDANAEDGTMRARGQGEGQSVAASASGGAEEQEQISAANDEIFEDAFSSTEVEQSIERDPESAAPVYPPRLMQAGIEGYAAMRFVVDSLGRVEMASVRVLEATHPEFAAAVRSAMPLMKFSPARIGDRPVRQLAEQLFRFQIVASVTTTDTMTARSPESCATLLPLF
jgi:TonB family protein